MSDLMNAGELGRHLGVTERTVRRWIERGTLKAEKRGGAFVILREDGERLRAGDRVIDERNALRVALAARDREIAVLEGRCLELRETLAAARVVVSADRPEGT